MRNNIDFECYYGSKKGAHLTLLEGSGNDMDQAALFVALLRAGGHTASYAHGPCIFALAAYRDWWGISSAPYAHLTDPEVITMVGGLTDTSPANVNLWRSRYAVMSAAKGAGYFNAIPFSLGGIECVAIPYTFVEFAWEGTTYNLSPAFKAYTRTGGINLVAATQYNRTNFLAAAGGSTGTPDYVSGLSESGISTLLSTYTNNLISTLRSASNHGKSVDELVGGRKINYQVYDSFSEVNQMVPDPGATWGTMDYTNFIRPERMSKLEIVAGVSGSYNPVTDTFSGTPLYSNEITMPSLQGKKLSLTFSGTGGNTASIRLDETLEGPTFTVSGADFDLRMKANHGHYELIPSGGSWVPTDQDYTNQSFAAEYIKSPSNVYTLVYSFGGADKQLSNRQQTLDFYRRTNVTDWRATTEGMNIMGLTYFKQVWAMEKALSPVYDVVPVNHHAFGRTAQENGSYYIDVGLMLSAPIQYSMNRSISLDYTGMNMLFTSAMEHGVIEQTQGSGALAASTVRLIQRANALGKRIYRATSSNKTAVLAGLDSGTYSTDTRAEISALLATANDRMLLPQTGTIVVGDKTMGGYAFENPSLFQMKIGKLHGGYSAYDNLDFSLALAAIGYGSDPGSLLAMSSYFSDASYMPYLTSMMYSWDPVEMASGAYVLDKTELALGNGTAPFGLKFSRHYHSNRRHDNSSGIGYGWTHNNDISLTERSAPDALMGSANGYQMAPFVAAALVAKDLHTNHANAKEWATCALAVHWAVEQMKYTAVAVTMGGRTVQFIKMPDGTYVPPPGLNLTLTKGGTTYTLSERHGNTMTFNSAHKIATIQNPNGATQTFTYNGSNKLTSVEDHFNRTLTYAWSGDNISSVSDGTGRTVSMGYNGNGDLVSCTDPETKVWTYQYDSEHRMTSFKDPDDRILAENDYDADSRVTRQRSMGDPNREWTYLYTGYVNTEIDPLGGTTRYYHDARGRSIGTANDLGHFDTTVYDGQDRKKITLDHKGDRFDWWYDSDNNIETTQDERGFYTDYFYDSLLRLEDILDARAGWTSFTYTPHHQIESTMDQVGNLIEYTYRADGLLESATDGEEKTTTTEYDSTGSIKKLISHDSSFQEFSNNARGDVLTTKDAEGRVTTNTWNKRRQLLTTTLPPISGQLPAVLTNTYDNSGNLFTSTDPKGNVTTRTWNSLAKPETTILPSLPAGNNVLTTDYDLRDWQTKVTNSLEHSADTEYDSVGRVAAVIDANGRRVENTVDANGRLEEVKDHLNRVTKFVWNSRGESTRTTNALDHHVISQFDGNGNKTHLTNRRGKTYGTVYDGANRPTSTTTPGGKTTAMTYFDNNLVKTILEPSAQNTTLAYNDKNLVSSRIDDSGTIHYAYDGSGLLETVTEGIDVITREYDERGRIKTITTADGDEISYLYDTNDNVTRITYPDGKQVNYTYNSRDAISTVTDWANRVTTYHYNRLGQLTEIDRPNNTNASMSYDDAGQLIEKKETANGKLVSYLRFDYDGAGQIERRFRAPLVNSGWTHPSFIGTYDDDNRLATVGGSGVTHDADGNMTYGPITPISGHVNLTYNSRNQLTNADGVSYTYDAEGRRRTLTDSSGTTRDVIDPNASMSRLLVRHHPDNSKTYYVYGIGLLYEVNEAGDSKTNHYDQVGSTIVRTDDNGNEIGWAEYSAYGLVVRKGGDMVTPFLYNDQWGITTDANGLLNMRARYYSPYLMRFLNADPIGFSGGMNWFAYADGDPISKSDPFGLWGWKRISGGLKVLGGVFEVVAGTALATATGVSGVGLVAGIAVAAHGIDTIQSGIRQMASGEQTDTFTSKGLQAAGMSQQHASIADAAIGIVGSVGTGLASGALRGGGGLVHMTDEAAAASIATQGVLKGSNFAGPASNATATGARQLFATGMTGSKVAVPIPAAAQSAFTSVTPIGSITSWQAAAAHMYSANGSLTLATGAFTRAGMNTTQASWYALDVILNGVRVADALK